MPSESGLGLQALKSSKQVKVYLYDIKRGCGDTLGVRADFRCVLRLSAPQVIVSGREALALNAVLHNPSHRNQVTNSTGADF